MFVRRAATLAVATTAALALSTGAASAHYCYFNDSNENADDGRAGSNAFVPFGDLAAMFLPTLCAEGIEHLAAAGGVEVDTLINSHGTMAGPTGGNKAIGHLDFAALEAAIPEAFAICGMEPPPPPE